MYVYKQKRVPFFSIVLCTFNRDYILPKAVDSVLCQIENDWELIIVDDGSTDKTSNIAIEFAKHSEKIKYIYQANKGLPLARNSGILASSGLYVAFLDSDDEYKEDYLDIRKKALLQNPDVDFVYGGFEVVGDEYVPDKYDPTKIIHLSECVVGGTFVVRREALLDLGGYRDISYSEDSDLLERATDADLLIASLDHPSYIYNRTLEDSITNKKLGLKS